MWFDRLCKMIEATSAHNVASAPLMQSMARRAALFTLENVVLSTDLRELSDADRNRLFELFHFPFPVVAIEDPDGACIIEDSNQDALGLFNRPMRFVEIWGKGQIASFRWGTFWVVAPVNDNFALFVDVRGMAQNDGGELYFFTPQEIRAVAREAGSQFSINLAVYVEEMRIINLPSYIIIESAPKKIRDPNSRLIPRSHERKTYTALKPGDIHIRYTGFSGTTHASPRTHQRRRHLRLLSSDRYVNKQGQYISVPASWVGKTEYSSDRRIYRVLLDR